MVARAGGYFPVAKHLEFPAHRCLAQRDAEFLPDPLHQVDQPPAHHPVDRRDRPALDNTRERLTLVIAQLRRLARRFGVDQPIWAAGVEAHHPIADDLQPDPAGPGRLRPPPAVIDHRQRQKPTRLIGVLRRPCQRPQIGAPEVRSQSNSCTHGKPPLFAKVIQSSDGVGIHKMSLDHRKLVLDPRPMH